MRPPCEQCLTPPFPHQVNNPVGSLGMLQDVAACPLDTVITRIRAERIDERQRPPPVQLEVELLQVSVVGPSPAE